LVSHPVNKNVNDIHSKLMSFCRVPQPNLRRKNRVKKLIQRGEDDQVNVKKIKTIGLIPDDIYKMEKYAIMPKRMPKFSSKFESAGSLNQEVFLSGLDKTVPDTATEFNNFTSSAARGFRPDGLSVISLPFNPSPAND
jgi:hypothetical protein